MSEMVVPARGADSFPRHGQARRLSRCGGSYWGAVTEANQMRNMKFREWSHELLELAESVLSCPTVHLR